MAELTIDLYLGLSLISIIIISIYLCFRYIRKLINANIELRLKIENQNIFREYVIAVNKLCQMSQR